MYVRGCVCCCEDIYLLIVLYCGDVFSLWGKQEISVCVCVLGSSIVDLGSVNEPQALLQLQTERKRKEQSGLHVNESINWFLTPRQMDRKQISISSFNPRMYFIS